MFLTIYKATFKNLFRTVTFWLCLAVYFIVAFQNATSIHYGGYSQELKEVIVDTDPRFVLSYSNMCKEISNSARHLLQYILPIFTTITAVIILNRDYNDHFYEIEKAGGIKSSHYLFARVSALISLNYLIAVISHFFAFHFYVYTRGGVSGMHFEEYLTQTTYRLMINNFFRLLPCVIFFVCFTYCIGTLFKSRIIAALCGMSYTIISMIVYRFTLLKAGLFLDYFTPNPGYLEKYLYGYYYENIKVEGVTIEQAAMCLALFFGLSLVFSLISYFRIRKRTV